MFSVGMHATLLGILVVSSAFRSEPPPKDIPIIGTLVNVPVLDKEGAGGGSPQAPAPAPQPPQPAPAPAPRQQPAPAPVPVEKPQPVTHSHPLEDLEHFVQRVIKQKEPDPEPIDKSLDGEEPTPRHKHKDHVIHPDFTPVSADTPRHRVKTSETGASVESSAHAEARLRRQIAQALGQMATHVQTSGAAGTVVDMPGQGGGAAFVGYETVIYNAYFHAWITPDGVANKLASADVKIVVARDGSILSAEIINRSGESALDRSVERALRAVDHLIPFPAGTQDEERTFLIRFNLEAKEASG